MVCLFLPLALICLKTGGAFRPHSEISKAFHMLSNTFLDSLRPLVDAKALLASPPCFSTNRKGILCKVPDPTGA
eukprot:5716736-Ditylum_brightwellii.AAC.1